MTAAIPTSRYVTAARGERVLVQAWAPSEGAAREMMEVADSIGSGLDLELGGVFGFGFGLNFGEAPAVTYGQRSHIPNAPAAWVGSGVAGVNGEINVNKLRAAAASARGAFVLAHTDAPEPSTFGEFAVEGPRAAGQAAREAAVNLAEVAGDALGGAVDSFGIGKAIAIVGVVAVVGALVVFGGPRLLRAVVP